MARAATTDAPSCKPCSPYKFQLRQYRRTADPGVLPTIARIWGAIRDGAAPVIVDQENLRVWVDTGNGVTELDHVDPAKRIAAAVAMIQTSGT